MDLLAAFRTFVRIAETGSFSAVAREVGATQPAISRQIAALEEHLGVRLLQRSTRSLRLTEDGHDLLTHARHVLEVVEEAEAAIGRRRASPSGMVRIGCPAVFGQTYLAPRMAALLGRYPDLSVDLAMSDEVQDMVQEGLDLAVRIGTVSDAALVVRRVGTTATVAVAAPAYLEAQGEPAHPAELSRHSCILFTRSSDPESWTFTGPDGPLAVTVRGRLRTSAIDAVMPPLLDGFGIAVMPTWLVRGALREGRLRRILTEFTPRRPDISLVYPSRRFLAPRTRAVIDFLVDEFRLDPTISAYGEE